MKLKHWQGYGTVNAKRVSNTKNDDGTKTLEISVTGMHEYGLVRNDTYDIHRWLVARFAKDCPDYRRIESMAIVENADDDVLYRITYRPADK